MAEQPARPGRKRDASRDGAILEAALAVLAETGYHGMTTDLVAARAGASKATMYRRWPSKAELVVEAVESLRDDPGSAAPDTGTLHGDLTALVRTSQNAGAARKSRIMTGLLPVLTRDADLAAATRRRVIEPRTAAIRAILHRAQQRGEIDARRDLDTLALAVAAMTTYRLLITGEPVDGPFLRSVVDEVLAPDG